MLEFVEFHSIATRPTLGTVSRNSSNRLPLNSSASVEKPLTFAPGRAKLATRPVRTGSPTPANTMGIVVVALFAASAAGVLHVRSSKPSPRRSPAIISTASCAGVGHKFGTSQSGSYSLPPAEGECRVTDPRESDHPLLS